jgi:nucleolar pre-ribosomal-associated protein 1
MHPVNTCQLTHIVPLLKLYRGTMTLTDRRLLDIFHLFEEQKQLSAASLLRQWTAHTSSASNKTLDAVMSLEPKAVFQTCISYPQRRSFTLQPRLAASDPERLYDPAFIILLFGELICEGSLSGFDWVEVFRTNVASVAICALASRDPSIRKAASTVIAGVLHFVKVRFEPSLLWKATFLTKCTGCGVSGKRPNALRSPYAP